MFTGKTFGIKFPLTFDRVKPRKQFASLNLSFVSGGHKLLPGGSLLPKMLPRFFALPFKVSAAPVALVLWFYIVRVLAGRKSQFMLSQFVAEPAAIAAVIPARVAQPEAGEDDKAPDQHDDTDSNQGDGLQGGHKNLASFSLRVEWKALTVR